MPVSTESIVCPYCGAKQSKHEILGNSGLINISGNERTMECRKCKQEFRCVMEVTIKFRTRKN